MGEMIDAKALFAARRKPVPEKSPKSARAIHEDLGFPSPDCFGGEGELGDPCALGTAAEGMDAFAPRYGKPVS